MQSRRMARLNALIAQTVSRLVLNLKDPGIGFVTITGADLSPDLSLARVYFSVLGEEAEKQETASALNRAKAHIRRELAKLENMKKVPEIAFIYDDAVERADRVHRILHTIEEERREGGPDAQ